VFKGSKVQEFKGSRVQRFKSSKVQEFKGSRVQRFKIRDYGLKFLASAEHNVSIFQFQKKIVPQLASEDNHNTNTK